MSLERKSSVPRVLTPCPAIQRWSFTTDTDSCSSTEEIEDNVVEIAHSKEDQSKKGESSDDLETTAETQILDSDVWVDESCIDVDDKNIIHTYPVLSYALALGYIGFGIVFLYSIYN